MHVIDHAAPAPDPAAAPPDVLASGRIPSLDGLRGVAILMVLLGHGFITMPPAANHWLFYAGNAQLGVNIFFALSGLLIYNLSARETQRTGRFDWKLFYVRRVLRIFPCFYLYLAVLTVLMGLGWIVLSRRMLLSAATFSLNYRPLWDHQEGRYNYEVIGHYWTLALEEQFYLTWPLLMFLHFRRRLLAFLMVVMAAAPLIRVASYFLAPGTRGAINLMFHTQFDSIAAGVLLGVLLRREASRRWLERAASRGWLVAGLLVFLTYVSPLLAFRWRGSYGLTVGKSLDLVSLGVVITAAVSFPASRLFRLLNWRPLAYVGVLSYSLYVWNNLFLLGMGRWFNVFPWNLGCVVAMALLSHYLVENPFLRLKEHFHRPT